ncbi:MAG TPA: hypothetical protein VKU85_03190, partial [bacterium]|nr:hypothetical protein [bacterium]
MKGKSLIAAAVVLAAIPVAPAAADDLGDVIDAGARNVELAQASQQRVDGVVEQTRSLEGEY